jgi:hypothetical protein
MIILIIILLLIIIFRPSIDIDEDNMVVLWYGRTKRKYIILIQGR